MACHHFIDFVIGLGNVTVGTRITSICMSTMCMDSHTKLPWVCSSVSFAKFVVRKIGMIFAVALVIISCSKTRAVSKPQIFEQS